MIDLDRIPMVEPWRSRWCRMQTLHVAAQAADQYTGPFAEARDVQYWTYQSALLVGIEPSGSHLAEVTS